MVGYSDHTLGTDVALLAVHLGAKVVEKHFTYDKKAEGPDHSASLSPEELKEMVKRIREYEASNLKEREKIISKINDKEIIFGSGKKEPCKREMVHIPVIRKSIVALREINSGETISEEMLIMKRAGGDGISAAEYKSLIGAIAEVKIMKDTLISWDEVKRR
jgi:sialic acid synthase SpsE